MGGVGTKGAHGRNVDRTARILFPWHPPKGREHITTVPITLWGDHKCVSGLRRHFSRRTRQLSKPYNPKRKHSTHVAPRLSQRCNLSCKSRAPGQPTKHRSWADSPIGTCSAQLASPRFLPSAREERSVDVVGHRRRDLTAGRAWRTNYLARGVCFSFKDTNDPTYCLAPDNHDRHTLYLTESQADEPPNTHSLASLSSLLACLGYVPPLRSGLESSDLSHSAQWSIEEGFPEACGGASVLGPETAARSFGCPLQKRMASAAHQLVPSSALTRTHAQCDLQDCPESV